jgi:hypothetical protein
MKRLSSLFSRHTALTFAFPLSLLRMLPRSKHSLKASSGSLTLGDLSPLASLCGAVLAKSPVPAIQKL